MSENQEHENKEVQTRGERKQQDTKQTSVQKDKKKKIVIAVVAVVAIAIIAAGSYFIYHEVSTANKMKQEAQQEQKVADSRDKAASSAEEEAATQNSEATSEQDAASKDAKSAESADKQMSTEESVAESAEDKAEADDSRAEHDGVDTNNLTQAQLESWVKATVEKDDTVKDKDSLEYEFVAMNQEGNEFPLVRVVDNGKTIQTYRVDAKGNLQEQPEGQDDWQTVTSSYYE